MLKRVVPLIVLGLLVVGCFANDGSADVNTKNASTGNIFGTVQEGTSSAPIKDAYVKLVELNITVMTDAVGGFVFMNISSGFHTLYVAKTGYGSFIKKTLVSIGDNFLDVLLWVGGGGQITHKPIRINSDTDPAWSEFPGRNISDYKITGAGYGCCLFIGNCSLPFSIDNCLFLDASGRDTDYFWNSGLFIYNSSNGTINNVRVNKNLVGICFFWYLGIMNNRLDNIEVSNNKYGIIFAQCGGISFNRSHLINNEFGVQLIDGSMPSPFPVPENSHYDFLNSEIINNTYGFFLYASDAGRIQYLHIERSAIVNNSYGLKMENTGAGGIGHIELINSTVGNNLVGFDAINIFSSIIKNNSFVQNKKYAANITNCEYFIISNNDFINNNIGGRQANDKSGLNFWNLSNSGNYWSDWCSPDNNSDGIVDFPYHLDGGAGATDYYPLASPVAVPESPSPPALALLLLVILPLVFITNRNKKQKKK